MPGASEEAIREVEGELGIRFPDDFRTFVRAENGVEAWFGEMYLMLYRIETLPELHRIHDHESYLPGFVFFGSDGRGELFGFDFRSPSPPIVMVGNVSSGWEDGLIQAGSFSEFMAKRHRGEPFSLASMAETSLRAVGYPEQLSEAMQR
ncbi:MAG: SMI1/KNR4 family protein [Actinomycetota bacterium]|nr:SMI1/KNR4 family protein [Actinomycetota bacterium]